MPITNRTKRIQAEDLAHALIDMTDTGVLHNDIQEMTDADLFEWLEVWDYEWTGSEWRNRVEERL